MARIVEATCPQCGAGLTVEAGKPVATCRYCGRTSVIEWQGKGAPPPPPPPAVEDAEPAPRIRVRTPPRRRSGAGCGGLVVLLLGAAAAYVFFKGRAPQASDVVHLVQGDKLTLPDPEHADLKDIVPAARAAAIKLQPAARLTSVVAQSTTGGLVDATRLNAANATFEYDFKDPTKPPGKDAVRGMIMVNLSGGALRATTIDGATTRAVALPDPKCAAKDAFAAAVKSGVPSNAVATLHLYDNAAFSPKSPSVWSFRVEGHDEYRREIDAMTCALVKSWAAK